MKAFDCKMCGECCKGKGGIRIVGEEINVIAKYLKITKREFLKKYCVLNGNHYYIKEKEDISCIFLDEDGKCLIHPCKPLPCKLWPYWKGLLNSELDWQALMSFCPGLNKDALYELFVKEGISYRQKIMNEKDERNYL
ncbi:MAG: hypothetical protein AMJ45_03095 [Syntrophobacter sp. DG_60]|nr:MAG: hypothetical protein AMJ45_03095 [Syntrophobacter sp. DG_60]